MINTKQIKAKDLKVNDYIVIEVKHLSYAKVSPEQFRIKTEIEYSSVEIKAIMELPNGTLGMEVLGLDSQPGYAQATKNDLVDLVVEKPFLKRNQNHTIKG